MATTNDSIYEVRPEDISLGVLGLSQKLYGTSSFAPELARINNLLGSELQLGQQLKLIPDQVRRSPVSSFAQSYVNSLPQNKFISQGLPTGSNPLEVVNDPSGIAVDRAATSFFFDPYTKKAYDRIATPARIDQNRRAGTIAQQFSDAGTLDSSLANRLQQFSQLTTEQSLDDRTDEVKVNLETQRIQEEQRRMQDRLALNQFLVGPLIAGGFELTPEQLAEFQSGQGVGKLSQGEQEIQTIANLLGGLSGFQQTGSLANTLAGNNAITPAFTSGEVDGGSIGSNYSQLLATGRGGEGMSISQGYGQTSFAQSATGKTIYGNKGHSGVDIVFAGGVGAPIPSPIAGVVVQRGFDQKGFGNWVKIQANDGTIHRLSHLNSQSPLQEGSIVQAGTVIGQQGKTGATTGPHLDWTIYESANNQTKTINPFEYIKKGSASSGATTTNNEQLIIQEAIRQGVRSPDQLAYILATAAHESNLTPILEKGGPAYLQKYQGRQDLGNVNPGDGVKYAGRGFVQLTGKNNYQKYSSLLGIDLVNNPDLALDPQVAAQILVHGIINGGFTGKKISDYTKADGSVDYYQARRIVNGLVDKQAQDVTSKSNTYKARLASGDLRQFLNNLK